MKAPPKHLQVAVTCQKCGDVAFEHRLKDHHKSLPCQAGAESRRMVQRGFIRAFGETRLPLREGELVLAPTSTQRVRRKMEIRQQKWIPAWYGAVRDLAGSEDTLWRVLGERRFRAFFELFRGAFDDTPNGALNGTALRSNAPADRIAAWVHHPGSDPQLGAILSVSKMMAPTTYTAAEAVKRSEAVAHAAIPLLPPLSAMERAAPAFEFLGRYVEALTAAHQNASSSGYRAILVPEV